MIWNDRNDSHLDFAVLLIIYATLQQSQVVIRVSNKSDLYREHTCLVSKLDSKMKLNEVLVHKNKSVDIIHLKH